MQRLISSAIVEVPALAAGTVLNLDSGSSRAAINCRLNKE